MDDNGGMDAAASSYFFLSPILAHLIKTKS